MNNIRNRLFRVVEICYMLIDIRNIEYSDNIFYIYYIIKIKMHETFFKTKTKKKKKSNWVKKISDKRKLRLSWRSEKDMFMEIWEERLRVCEICWIWILEPKTYSFAHRCPKGTYPEHRLNKNNISLVCSIKCHWEVDKIYSWIKRQQLINNL